MSYTNYNTSFLRNKLIIPVGARLDGVGGPSLWNPTVDQRHGLGRILELDDGTNRFFKYLENGATEIAKARMVASEATDAQTKDTLQTAYTQDVGDTVIDILATTGNAINDGDMINSWMFVNQGATGVEGDCYLINNNKWVTGDTVLQLILADQDGIRNAIAATANLTIVKNKNKDVIVKPVTLTGPMIGVTLATVPISYFFWAQFAGPTVCIIDTGDTVVAGEPVGHIDGSGTVGSVGLVSSHATDNMVGHLLTWADGADFGLVDLTNMG
jgi:hypothetical protein